MSDLFIAKFQVHKGQNEDYGLKSCTHKEISIKANNITTSVYVMSAKELA